MLIVVVVRYVLVDPLCIHEVHELIVVDGGCDRIRGIGFCHVHVENVPVGVPEPVWLSFSFSLFLSRRCRCSFRCDENHSHHSMTAMSKSKRWEAHSSSGMPRLAKSVRMSSISDDLTPVQSVYRATLYRSSLFWTKQFELSGDFAVTADGASEEGQAVLGEERPDPVDIFATETPLPRSGPRGLNRRSAEEVVSSADLLFVVGGHRSSDSGSLCFACAFWSDFRPSQTCFWASGGIASITALSMVGDISASGSNTPRMDRMIVVVLGGSGDTGVISGKIMPLVQAGPLPVLPARPSWED